MHSINIGVGGNNYFVVPKSFQPVFYLKCMLEKVQFFIQVDNFFSHPKAIERLPPQTENSLIIDISCLSDRTTCRISFRDKDRRLKAIFLLGDRKSTRLNSSHVA